jgi:putative serine protease PepD
MDDTTQPPDASNEDDTEPQQPINPAQQPTTPIPADPWSIPSTAGVTPPPPAEPTQPIPAVPPVPASYPVPPVQQPPQFPPPQPTQPYGDPYAAGYTGSGWGASAAPVSSVPPVGDPWLPPGGAALPPRDVVASSGSRDRGRRGGLTLVAVALAAGLIGGGTVGAVVLATRTSNDGTSSTAFSAAPTSTTTPTAVTSRPAGTVAAVAQDVLPSVVSILESNGQEAGEGSGIILDTQGHILTNNHVVADVASGGTLTVTFQDGSSAKATIVGRDPLTDIAVIKVNGKSDLKPATLGSSASLQVGDQVIAIGSPLGLSGTVTEGIVSALNRPVITSPDNATSATDTAAISAIQTDAAINPGNSGGALVNADGDVVGVNSAIATVAQNSIGGSSQSGNIGVGFAIPIDQAKRIATELLAGQTPAHAMLGVSLDQNQDSELTSVGAKVIDVKAGSAAAKAGFKVGDVVTKVNGNLVQGNDGLIATIRSFAPDTSVQLTYTRGGATHTVDVTLGSDAKS